MRIANLLIAAGLLTSCRSFAPAPSHDLLLQPEHSEWSKQAPERYIAEFETSRGNFAIQVERAWAPRGADRFYNLVRNGYYNDVRFHRVLPRYIVQWGLHGEPEVNRIWTALKIRDDSIPQASSNVRGTIGFAMTKPNDRGTQVYINLADNARNDGQGLMPFGRVIEGMAVVDSLYDGYGPNSGNGVRQGQQGPLVEGGNAYMDREFPKLDRLIRARIRR